MSICLHIYAKDGEDLVFRIDEVRSLVEKGNTSGELWDIEDGINLEEMDGD